MIRVALIPLKMSYFLPYSPRVTCIAGEERAAVFGLPYHFPVCICNPTLLLCAPLSRSISFFSAQRITYLLFGHFQLMKYPKGTL